MNISTIHVCTSWVDMPLMTTPNHFLVQTCIVETRILYSTPEGFTITIIDPSETRNRTALWSCTHQDTSTACHHRIHPFSSLTHFCIVQYTLVTSWIILSCMTYQCYWYQMITPVTQPPACSLFVHSYLRRVLILYCNYLIHYSDMSVYNVHTMASNFGRRQLQPSTN